MSFRSSVGTVFNKGYSIKPERDERPRSRSPFRVRSYPSYRDEDIKIVEPDMSVKSSRAVPARKYQNLTISLDDGTEHEWFEHNGKIIVPNNPRHAEVRQAVTRRMFAETSQFDNGVSLISPVVSYAPSVDHRGFQKGVVNPWQHAQNQRILAEEEAGRDMLRSMYSDLRPLRIARLSGRHLPPRSPVYNEVERGASPELFFGNVHPLSPPSSPSYSSSSSHDNRVPHRTPDAPFDSIFDWVQNHIRLGPLP